MALEKLFNESIDTGDDEKLEKAIGLIMSEWVYFFVFEREGVDTPVSTDKVDYIITTSKENPINIPLIQDENSTCGVIYFTSEHAKKCAEFNCKIGKMKGAKAFELFLDLPVVDEVCLQSSVSYVLLPNSEIRRLLEKYA